MASNENAARNLDIWKEYKAGGITMKKLGEKYKLSVQRIRDIIAKEDRRITFNDMRIETAKRRAEKWSLDTEQRMDNVMWDSINEIPLDELELSIRALNALKNFGIDTFDGIVRRTDEQLLAIPNFGRTTLDEVRQMQRIYSNPKAVEARLGYFTVTKLLKQFEEDFHEIIETYEQLKKAADIAWRESNNAYDHAWKAIKNKENTDDR